MNVARITSRDRHKHSSKTSDQSSFKQATSGFTLVELLVVILVLLILIVMTVTTIDFTFNSERLRSGSRQLQSALEGARDRAIFAKEPRGLRLLLDPDEPRIVTNLIYVGASQNWSEGTIILKRLDNNGDGVADPPYEVRIVEGVGTAWSTLSARGYLGIYEDLNLNQIFDAGEDLNGNGVFDLDAPRIKIPGDDNGSWYTVLTNRLATSNQLELITAYRDPGTTPTTSVVAFDGGGPKTYILELPPRILPDAQPILLPEGICIDLDASDVPVAWRPGVPAVATSIENQYAKPYSSHMDIMFSPRGVVTGPLAAQGLLHLYLAERKDVIRATNEGVTGSTLGPAAPRRPPVFGNTFYVPSLNQFDANNPIGQRSITTIFTQTGKVSTHQIDPTDADSNGYADNPFQYAAQGEAISQ